MAAYHLVPLHLGLEKCAIIPVTFELCDTAFSIASSTGDCLIFTLTVYSCEAEIRCAKIPRSNLGRPLIVTFLDPISI